MNRTNEALDSTPPGLPRPSLWSVGQDPHKFPELTTDLSLDVAIIGGGITGMTAAVQLMRSGRNVVVLEAKRIGFGATGHATGNLYGLVDEHLYKLEKKWGQGNAAAVVQSRLGAIDLIERNIAEYHLNCDFSRQPWLLYATRESSRDIDEIEAEFNAAVRAGLNARLTSDVPLPYNIRNAVVVLNQAQFNPFKYVRELAAAVRCQQCQVYEDSPVVDIDEENGIVRTASHSVRADHIIMASHTPKGFNVVQTEMGVYREYAVAAWAETSPLPDGIFWSTGDKLTSTRAVKLDGRHYVLMVGEKHKSGQVVDPNVSYQNLAELLQSRFGVGSINFQWSAQHYRSVDGLPYIGCSPGASNIYIASGFGTDGLTYGSLAGMMLSDEICGVQNQFAELYSPRRFTPLKSAKNFIKENLDVASHYIKDYTHSAIIKSFSNIRRGEGGLVDVEGEKLAVYRDGNDRLHIRSAVCTHLKCIVHWNRAESNWDCPCHGSRFDYEGNVIEGPALLPLHHPEMVVEDFDSDTTPRR